MCDVLDARKIIAEQETQLERVTSVLQMCTQLAAECDKRGDQARALVWGACQEMLEMALQ
jgi:hypothetical protein